MFRSLNRAILFVILCVAARHATAQGWDNSGNNLLNGTYYFREVFYVVGDNAGDLQDALALYGTVAFDGKGSYTMNATVADLAAQSVRSGTLTGTYTIAASGYGSLSNPLSSGDFIYGLVAQNGVFVGSSTESQFNDLMIAAPTSSQTNLATFKGSYWVADMDQLSGAPAGALSAMFQLNPDGAGNLGNVAVTGYVGQGGTTQYTQSLTRITYQFSNGAYNLSIPNVSSGMISGQKFLYISPDGNFVFGGSPTAADFFVGVRTGSGTPNLGGLYYQAGIDEPVDSNLVGYLDSYYGALNGGSGTLIGHQRVDDGLSGTSYDYTYSSSYTVKSDGTYSDAKARYAVGAGGAVRIASGIGPNLGISVALAAPTLTGSGVFLNPQGVVNAGNWAPFTAGIVPGAFIALVGTGLAPDGLPISNTIPFPNNVGGVQVMINGTPAPIYYAAPTIIEAIVPYGITGAIAQIQVINNNVNSNTVTSFIGTTAPGVFTANQNGLGYARAQHTDYSLVTPSSPAKPGETLFVYLTGLGTVTPSVSDGYAAPQDSLTKTTQTITAQIGGQTAAVSFSGLTPSSVSLGQVNVVVPTTATAGDNVIAISGPDSFSSEALIPISTTSAASASVVSEARTNQLHPVPDRVLVKRREPKQQTTKIRLP
jgi:uncharacterized protein (TIGR03437 family)